ncbi:MAG: xylulokinase [Petroclostridium sp.]|uniref:FGGY-family carbohydrate kinase n=1 Tax=Petroclostridium xylanilyticum TaxID=1792311 RepID=UPI000B996FFD|nr:FGGY family carbohydrate kinase [Petroclostridium xylanilyticum]MDK2809838.1 xylulokinase [Petroclostridium sp.]
MKRELILGVDVGTSSVKIGIFDQDLNVLAENKHFHMYSTVGKHVEMDGDVLFQSFLSALKPLEKYLGDVVAMGFSVLCPGMFCLTEEGQLLRPGIIHLDRRSEKQGLEIVEKIGEEEFLKITGNLPYPGGMSVTSMLWVKENEPEIYEKTYKFGHTNTLFIKRLTNVWGVDPTNASFTGLYDTVGFSDWNDELCERIGIPREKLPPIIASANIAGYLTEEGAKLTGLKQGIPIIMGAGDTACATYGAGVVEDGQLMNSTGTVEVMVLCTDKPYYSRQFLLRTHVIPGKWIIMNIIGAGGESLNWFYKVFCKDMSKQQFFEEYLPKVLAEYDRGSVSFTPYLAGDRNSIKDKAASLTGLTLSATREHILYAVVHGVIKQLEDGMDTFRKISNISDTIYYTGGGSNALSRYKERVFADFKFKMVDNCAMKGIAKLIKLAVDHQKCIKADTGF